MAETAVGVNCVVVERVKRNMRWYGHVMRIPMENWHLEFMKVVQWVHQVTSLQEEDHLWKM